MERIVKGTEPAEPQAEDKWQKGDFLQQQERPSAKSRLGSRVETNKDAMPLQKRFEIELDEKEEGYGFYTIQLYCQVSLQLHEECFVVPSTLITHSLQT